MKMYDNILQKVALYQEKRGIVYAKTDGKLYKTLKVFYVLAFCYTLAINAMFMLGTLLSDTTFQALKNSVFTVLGLSLGLVAGLVIMRFKNQIWANVVSFVINLFCCVALCFTFAVLLEDVIGFKASFYWRHLVPLCVMVLLMAALFIIGVRATVKTQKTYKKILENIYSNYNANEDSVITDEQWEEALKTI